MIVVQTSRNFSARCMSVVKSRGITLPYEYTCSVSMLLSLAECRILWGEPEQRRACVNCTILVSEFRFETFKAKIRSFTQH